MLKYVLHESQEKGLNTNTKKCTETVRESQYIYVIYEQLKESRELEKIL